MGERAGAGPAQGSAPTKRVVRSPGVPWAEGIVVYRLDRLARDLVLQEQLLAELRRVSAAVFSTSAGEDAYLADDRPTRAAA